jgi:FtsH-binding integral membrane protein
MRLHDEFIVLVSITAATSLLVSTLMVKADRLAPILLPSFVAYTVLFGLTLSSLPLVYEIDVIKRMAQIFFAAAYALGAVSLLVPIIGWLKAAFRMRRAF